MKVGIVMTTINLWEKYTKPAIDSVFGASVVAVGKDIHTGFLLIDNASTDETKDEATKLLVPGADTVFYHRNEERWGFQRSVNFGVEHFLGNGYDLVLVLNNDIVLHKDAIWRLVERFKKGGVGMATCMDVRGEFPDARSLLSARSEDKEAVAEAPHPNFSAFMLDRECWEKTGEFDELYFPAYFEDNDYHYRMGLAGVASVVCPTAMFLHWGSRTQNEALGAPIVSGPDFENKRALYTAKWGGPPGGEQFKRPYDNGSLSITSVKQKDIQRV